MHIPKSLIKISRPKLAHQASLKKKKVQLEFDKINAETHKENALANQAEAEACKAKFETKSIILSILGKLWLGFLSFLGIFGIGGIGGIGRTIPQPPPPNYTETVLVVARTEGEDNHKLGITDEDRLRADINKIMDEGKESIKNGRFLVTVNKNMINNINSLRKTYPGEQNKEIIDSAIQQIQFPSSQYV